MLIDVRPPHVVLDSPALALIPGSVRVWQRLARRERGDVIARVRVAEDRAPLDVNDDAPFII